MNPVRVMKILRTPENIHEGEYLLVEFTEGYRKKLKGNLDEISFM